MQEYWDEVPANKSYAKQAVLGESCFADKTKLALTTREFSQNSCVSQQSYFGRNLYCVHRLICGVELTLQQKMAEELGEWKNLLL